MWPERNPRSADPQRGRPIDEHPTVLFTCSHNAARSIIAAGVVNRLAAGGATATSGGTYPAAAIAAHVVAALTQVGIDVREQSPRVSTAADIPAADLVVTLTGVEDVPILDGVRYEHWEDSGHTASLEQMRDLRDAPSARVRDLLERMIPVG